MTIDHNDHNDHIYKTLRDKSLRAFLRAFLRNNLEVL
jgi:hypothetical protein